MQLVAIEFIGRLGRSKLKDSMQLIDPVPLARLEATMDTADYIGLLNRRERLSRTTEMNMREAGLDGWVMPTVPHSATPVANLQTVADVAKWNARTFQITRLANILEQVAISIPLRSTAEAMPVGLQVCGPNGRELELLAMASVIEECLSPHRL